MARSFARWCFLASLGTLPWIGVGVARLVTGRDLGAGLQPSWLLLAVATVALASTRRPAEFADIPPSWRRWGLACGAALLLSALGLVLVPGTAGPAAAWSRYLRQVIQLAVMACFFVWPALWVRGSARWSLVARILVIAGLGQVAYGMLQQLHWWQPGPLLPALEVVFTSNPAILSGSEQLHIGDSFRDLPRLRGTACEPLYLGNFLLLVIPLVPLTGWRRAVRLAVTALLVALLVLTWSRGAWLAGLAAATLGLVLAPPAAVRERRRLLGAAVLVAVAAGLVALALGPERWGLPLERLAQSFSRRDWSNLTRLYSMQAAWRAFLASPLVGVGWGQYPWHFPVLVDPAGLQSQFTWPVVNNFPLRILAETGVIGCGVFAAAVGALARAAWRLRASRQVRLTAVACAGVWLQLLVFSQYNLPHIWVAPGLVLAALAQSTADQA
jgi:O-antigen ligase